MILWKGRVRPALGAMVLFFTLVSGFGTGSSLDAQTPTPGWSGSAGVLAGANPTVLGVRGGVWYTAPLYPEREDMLFQSARIELGAEALTNPSFSNVGGRLYLEPIAVADVTVRAGIRSFTDTLGFGLVGLDGYDAPLPAVTGEDADGSSETGWYLSLAPRLKAAVGPILVTNTFTATYLDFRSADANYLQEPFTVTAVSSRDWVLENSTNLLYQLEVEGFPFLALGVEQYVAWVPAAGSEQRTRQRVSAVGAATRRLSDRLSLQTAGLVGVYPTEVPFALDRPYAIAVVDFVFSL